MIENIITAIEKVLFCSVGVYRFQLKFNKFLLVSNLVEENVKIL